MPFSPHFTITNAIAAAWTKVERARGFRELKAMVEKKLLTVEGATNRLTYRLPVKK